MMKIFKRNASVILKIIIVVFCLFCFYHFMNKITYQEERAIENIVESGPSNQLQDESYLKDWHNYKLIEEEKLRNGPGEHGQAYFLPPESQAEKDKLYKANGFNARASDDISLNRSISDIRHQKCKSMLYPSTLPKTSVVIPFHNEHLSTLLRTVWSVINKSPVSLLQEIILVDDGSTKEFLKDDLDKYVIDHFSNVNIMHLSSRAGLIRARLAGAKKASGDVIVFLDSHTECNVNWLPPLLTPIAEDYRTCVCPFIDVIDYENFAYRAQDEGARGAFDWQLYYKRLPLLSQDKINMPEPFKSPVMAGGLFGISAKFFWEVGGYDPGLDIWGGEQYELSFKIWQCGGRMLDAPCSRVGHIYRKFAPYSNAGRGDFLGRNYKRVAEVWMDEYAEYIYKRRPHYRQLDAGDLSEQKAIRERLKCKPFKWFIQEVAFDLVQVYPPIEPPPFAHGFIQSVLRDDLCVDAEYKSHLDRFGLKKCGGGDQVFELTWHKDVRPRKRSFCWDVSSVEPQAPIILYGCHGVGGNQLWKYDYKSLQLIHGVNPRCLDANVETGELFVSTCVSGKASQQWKFESYDSQRLDNWNQDGVLL